MELSFIPTLDRSLAEQRLELLLVPGSLLDHTLAGRIDRLAGAFRNYASCYPLPLWAPGLAIGNEMRSLTEALFPIAPVTAVFDHLLRRSCRFPPQLAGSGLHGAASWLDLVQKLRPQTHHADPSALLRELARDEKIRRRFIFALFLPQHFGAAFDRYPQQSRWLAAWLRDNAGRLKGRMRALDSACGSGEGTYTLAEQIRAAGLGGDGCAVHGSTLEQIELFAAAHLFFPHEPERERQYRARVAPLFQGPDVVSMEFYLEEIANSDREGEYRLILCNGLLGGPMLHEPGELSRAVGKLASRLAPGGVLLAADRFHAGWRQRVPASALDALLREHGLVPLTVPEGVGGRKASSR